MTGVVTVGWVVRLDLAEEVIFKNNLMKHDTIKSISGR